MAGIGLITPPERTGRPTRLSADGYPIWMDIGATIAWELVSAAGSATTLADGTPIAVGDKYIEIGTPMVRITTAEVNTVTIDATGGTFTLTLTTPDGQVATTPALAWNASAATVQAALQALPNVGSKRVTVALASLVYTLTWSPQAGNIGLTSTATGLTGGGGTAVVATTTQGIVSGGKFAPADTSASNGQQTLTRGDVGLMDNTIKQQIPGVYNVPQNTELTGLIIGGLVFRDRLKVGGTNQVTLANLLAAMPQLELTRAE